MSFVLGAVVVVAGWVTSFCGTLVRIPVREVVMVGDGPAWPVQRFEFSTCYAGQAEDFIRQAYTGNRTRFGGASGGTAEFSITVAAAGDLTASRGLSTVDWSAALDPFACFLALAPRRGQARLRYGRDETILEPGAPGFYPVGIPVEVAESGSIIEALELPWARLATVAEETAGIAGTDLRFESITPVSAAMSRQWSAFMDLACGILLQEDSMAGNPLLAENLARTAAVTALHTFPNTALTVAYQPGPGWVTTVSIRRAAAFIHAHAGQPLALEQIAGAAGTGVRALQYGFRRYYGTTPLGYLRRIRLEQAHAELRAADPAAGVTVGAVARRWGWASPSQFAAAYRQRFGVPPSRTLRS